MALRPQYAKFPHRGLVLVTPPAVEPVTPQALRNFLKESIEGIGDSEAELLIKQARNYLEEATGIAFITQTWRVSYDRWPGYAEPWWDGVREMAITELHNQPLRAIELPRYPLISVEEVLTYNEAGAETSSVVADVFKVDTISRPGRLALKVGQIWPIATQEINAIEIEFVAGFGPLASSVPPILSAAVMTLAAYYYDHRGECEMPEAARKSGALDAMKMYTVRGL